MSLPEGKKPTKIIILNGPTAYFVIQITAKRVGLLNIYDEQWMLN